VPLKIKIGGEKRKKWVKWGGGEMGKWGWFGGNGAVAVRGDGRWWVEMV
jgi:hypothetical protein